MASWTLPEWQEVTDARPLRQGDIVARRETNGDLWDELAVVVTGDCDIARDKHAGRLSAVPVLPVTAYLAAFYLPRLLSRLQGALAERLVSAIRRAQAAQRPEFSRPVSEYRVARWVLESSPTKVAAVLRLPAEDANSFVRLAYVYAEATTATAKPYRDQCRAYCSAQMALGRSRDEAAARNTLSRELRDHLRGLPGDALFLSSISPHHTAGYVCYLRILREFRDAEIAIRATRRSFDVSWERISRLQSPYVFRLTQQLGSVFSSIALPNDYEQLRESYGANLVPDL